MPDLKRQPNENRCWQTIETHILPIAGCCPISKNPLPGSKIEISYRPYNHCLEVAALRDYVDSYIGGRGDIRSMEGMIQQIAHDSACLLNVQVDVKAMLLIAPGQEMQLHCIDVPQHA